MPHHPLTNFEIQKYYNNEPRFNGLYSRDKLPDKIKDETYVINLHENPDIGTHWIALYALNNNVTYLDSFGAEHIPKEIKNIYWQFYSSNKYSQNTSLWFSNVWIFLYWIYWFYALRHDFSRLY